jgi:HPt (histidine-containing phosphotransfer) domain-containing protein
MTSKDDPGNGDSMKNGVIDWSVLEDYLAFRKPGRPDPRRRIITAFLDSSPKLIEASKAAISSADGSQLSKAAHSLKSASMMVGAGGLGSLCAELERTGRVGAIEEAKTLAGPLETQYAAVTAALKDALQHMDK